MKTSELMWSDVKENETMHQNKACHRQQDAELEALYLEGMM